MSEDAAHDRELPFVEHLRELRRRLMISLWGLVLGGIAAWFLYDYYIPLLIKPFGQTLYIMNVTEAFVLKLQFSIWVGFVVSIPLYVYNVTAFVVPALTRKERRILGWLLGSGCGLALAGLGLAYEVILPRAVSFLLGNGLRPEGVQTHILYADAVGFVVQVMLAFVILFQAPLLMVVLMAFDVVKRATFLRFSRYFMVLIFILAAVFTPPDVGSQIGLAIPLILLYYLAILVAKICGFGNEDS